MLDQTKQIYEKYLQIRDQMQSPDIASDYSKYSELNKSLKDIEPIAGLYKKRMSILHQLSENRVLLLSEHDDDICEMLKEEISSQEEQIIKIDSDIKILLLPKDQNDSRNIILEIRAGTGGDEAGIFAGDLFRMYFRYCERKKWQINIVNFVDSTSGGYKEIVCNIVGNDVYGMLKFESGVHRVQRIPITETQGRIHTSAASVVVMPEVSEVDVQLNMNDIKKDTFCSSGHGGQSVNTTYSAVRLTHIPTGIVVTCQDERSQIKNFDRAMNVLRSRLYDIELSKQQQEIGEQKRLMVKRGDRSDKIRTYNFPQNRVTDHRIGLTSYRLEEIMNGEIDEFVDALRIANNTQQLESAKVD